MDNFKELIQWLNKYNFKVILLGTKKDESVLKKLAGYNENCLVVVDFNIRQLSILFKKSSLVISQEGGPMHIAWVSRAKLIAIIPTFGDITYNIDPLGKNTKIIKDSERINISTNIDIKKDFLDIDIEKVKKDVKRFLDKT